MFDCGEGVQRQMIKAKVSLHKKLKIFISHLHGDHVLGLPGLLQTMALLNREIKLEIYGPQGIKLFLKAIKETVQFLSTFPIEICDINEEGLVCEEEEYVIQAVFSKHIIPSLSYAFIEKPRPGKFYPDKAKALGIPEGPLWSKLQHGNKVELLDGRTITPEKVTGQTRPGRKIVYTGDTNPFDGFPTFAVGADLLIHDCTFEDALSVKAKEDGHSTPSQAAKNAKKSKAKQLILTHISARYADTTILLKQAKKFFKNTQIAEDLMIIELNLLKN